MFKTNLSGISRRRALQAPELRASDCRYYASKCLPEAARVDAQQMNCATCRLKDDIGAALTTLDPDFLFEIACARKLLYEIFNGGIIHDAEINETE